MSEAFTYRSLKGTVAKQREGVLQSCELNILVQETFTRIKARSHQEI